MGGSCLAERFGRHLELTTAERRALERLEDQERTFRRGTRLISEHSTPREMFVLHHGWAHSSLILGNGNRQIMRFHFRGDLLGLALLAFRESPETVEAVTDVTVCAFSRERLAGLLHQHPRLASLLLSLSLSGCVGLADRLASIGRTSARARIAALLCELDERLTASGLADTEGMPLPLTQEELGDATGLTAVHVNRMMRALAEDGLIERRVGRVRLLDRAGLQAAATFVPRNEGEVGWLVGQEPS